MFDMVFSLISVEKQVGSTVSGYWMQNITVSSEKEARKIAREKSGKDLKVIVVKPIAKSAPPADFRKHLLIGIPV